MQMSLIETKRLARRTDPETSHAAAARVHEFKAGHNVKILAALKSLGQAGAEQIAEIAGLQAHAVRRRTVELQRNGLIHTCGEYRLTVSGRRERVWEIR